MDDAGIGGRYARALFDLADQNRALDRVAEDVTRLQAMINESPDLLRLLRSPVISRADQGRAIAAVAERAEFSDLTRRFVGLVARNRRLFALPDMIRSFRALIAKRRGESSASVTSAVALKDDQLAALRAALRQITGTDVQLEVKVDPDLLGGLVVRMGSRMLDSSLRAKLQRLQFVLKGAA
jgi:F-type H+-transporting ATPase subunit delta